MQVVYLVESRGCDILAILKRANGKCCGVDVAVGCGDVAVVDGARVRWCARARGT